MTDIVIVGAARTAVGSLNGAFSTVPAHELGAAAISGALQRAKLGPAEVDEVILGQVLTAGHGQNPARQAAMKAGVPQEKTAFGINQVCGSGLRAVALGMQQIESGDADIIVAGGQESMSQAHHSMHARSDIKMGDLKLVDTMVSDGLIDAFHHYHMGQTAENIAVKWQLTRDEQDRFALTSQQKAEAAQMAGKFDEEIIPFILRGKKGDVSIDKDEYIRAGTTFEGLSKLRPAFNKDGSVTAGNASGINDGGAAVVLMTAKAASARGLEPLARIASWATAGVDPAIMGAGPIPATRKALKRAGWKVGDLDLIEANEAFAAQALAVVKDIGLDPERVNVNGGAIAIGHPIGASGARILVTLLHELRRTGGKKGLATLCIGGGMGIALAVER
jgi:acetyl-CoA C-acetyltransferase